MTLPKPITYELHEDNTVTKFDNYYQFCLSLALVTDKNSCMIVLSTREDEKSITKIFTVMDLTEGIEL